MCYIIRDYTPLKVKCVNEMLRRNAGIDFNAYIGSWFHLLREKNLSFT
jgi:hypothetical protein